MPDISMCMNKECLNFKVCYRAQAKPNEWRQSYADFKPDEEGNCPYFEPMFEKETQNEQK